MDREKTYHGWLAPIATLLSLAACYGTLAVIALLGALGFAIALDEGIWAGAIVAFTLLAVLGLGLGIKRHGTTRPLLIGAIGAAAIVYAMLVSYDPAIEIAGFALLVIAALDDWRGSRRRQTGY